MLLENIGWKIGCVAGKYGLENRSCLLENRGWKTGCVACHCWIWTDMLNCICRFWV